MPLKPGQNLVKEKVYVFRGTPKLLLGILAIRHLGLIHFILRKYVIKAIEEKVSPPPLRSKEDVLKAYPKLFTGLGKLKGENNIRLNEDAKPFCMTSPRRSTLTRPVEIGKRNYSLNSCRCHGASRRTHWMVCLRNSCPKVKWRHMDVC